VGDGIGDGGTAPQLDGTSDYISIESNDILEPAINGAEGTVAIWFKVASGVWTDGNWHYLFNCEDDSNNRFVITKMNTDGNLYFVRYGGGVGSTHTESGLSSTDWNHVAMTWSEEDDEVKYYLNGNLLATDTSIGAWAGDGAFSPLIVGASSFLPGFPWKGSLAHFALCDKALVQGGITDLATV
jgi:hypothetical protein